MSALLRVADGLDRGHTASVERVDLTLNSEQVLLQLVPRVAGADLSLESWGAERKGDVLAKVLDRDIVIEPARLG
jgi:exopolyphosphatase/guanosine-5'-triphosphate,3'-diphosphate pyrophosphatase